MLTLYFGIEKYGVPLSGGAGSVKLQALFLYLFSGVSKYGLNHKYHHLLDGYVKYIIPGFRLDMVKAVGHAVNLGRSSLWIPITEGVARVPEEVLEFCNTVMMALLQTFTKKAEDEFLKTSVARMTCNRTGKSEKVLDLRALSVAYKKDFEANFNRCKDLMKAGGWNKIIYSPDPVSFQSSEQTSA